MGARLTLDNSTVSGNTSDQDGGGVYDNNGGGLFSASAATYTFDNVLLGDNSASGMGADCVGTFVSSGNNLIESLTTAR